jgi:hypothetical protein
LALQKFERENKNYKSADTLLDHAQTVVDSERVFMQAVQLQREIGNIEKAMKLIE